MTETVAVNAVATSFAIIEHMAAHGGPIGVSEVARLMGTGRPRVFRHLRTLLELGYVAQDPATEKYMLTPRLFHIGQAIADQNDFLAAARRLMPELSRRVKLTVSVAQVESRGVRILDILRHRSPIEITTPPGTLFEFHSSAQGKVALAFTPELLDRLLKGATPTRVDGTPIDAAALRREVEQVRRQAWAASVQEVLIGVNALAAPVFDGSCALAGTIAIVGSAQFLPGDPPAETVAALVSTARQISEQLGYREGDIAP